VAYNDREPPVLPKRDLRRSSSSQADRVAGAGIGGALLGAALGGPAGAVLGAIVGLVLSSSTTPSGGPDNRRKTGSARG
jgi:hypothetical protein